MKVKYNNLSLILENIKNRLKILKEKWMDGKKSVNKQMQKHKD
jgi:hypothetical protein